MLLRTISVETAEQTELNAALLCGFAIPASDRNFIAYSLNEQVDETDSRVYIASLFKTDDGFRLGRLDTDEACEAAIQVFRQLVREATTGNRRTSDLAYHLIDLQDAAIAPSRREEHRSLVLEREWVMKLVTFESPHGYGPALDGEEPCADVPPLVHEALFEDAAPDVLAADDADEATDGPAEPIDEPEAAEDETVTEAGCAEPEPRPEAETAAPEGRAPAEFPANAEQSAKVADAEAIGAFVDNASHLREELADLAQLLHPALHAADATGSANLPSPDAAEEYSMPPSPSPLAASVPAPEPVSARVPSLSLRLRVPPARLAGAEGEADAREAPTQAAAVIRQPEDEAHVDTDTALDIGNDTEHLLQDVQGTLADLAGMAQQLSQQKQEALKQQESLESLQTQLHEKERQLQEKESSSGSGTSACRTTARRWSGKPSKATVSWPSAARPCNNSRKASKPASAAARGEPRYCRSSRNASKSCAASRTCVRPNWKSAKPASSSAAWNSASASRSWKAPARSWRRSSRVSTRPYSSIPLCTPSVIPG